MPGKDIILYGRGSASVALIQKLEDNKRTLTVNKQVVKRNFGADVRKAVEQKGKREQRSSWYFTTPKTAYSARTVPLGDTLYEALKAEYTAQKKMKSSMVNFIQYTC